MIKNYFKIAFRSLIRDKTFSILNIAGLAVGLASVFMIIAYVRYELSYDKSYSNHTRVYRLLQESKILSTNEFRVYTPIGLAETFKKEFPGISSFSIVNVGQSQFKYHNEIVSLKNISGGIDFFKLFNFTFISGNPATALKYPESIVITETVAKKFFAGKNPVGGYLTDNNGRQKLITAVIKDIPASTHINGEVITSLNSSYYLKENFNWGAYNSAAQYILLNKDVDAKKVEASFKSIYKKYNFPKGVIIHLQPVTDIHLQSHAQDELMPNSDIKYIYIFSSIAFLILVIACINYINLTTARSLRRAREIGLRKVLGAMKKQLIIQFLTESFLFFLLGTLLAILIAYAVWPYFSAKVTLYQQPLPLFDINLLLIAILICVIGGLLSGAYPAFFLSSLQPVKVLKGLSKYGINISMRKTLVVMQFVISGVLITSTIVVHQQLNYVSNARLGFNKDNLISIPFYTSKNHVDAFKHELNQNSSIHSVTVASWHIGQHYGAMSSMKDEKDSTKLLKFQFVDADLDFIKTLDIQITSGRNFSNSYAADVLRLDSLFRIPGAMTTDVLASKSIILNQEAVKLLGLKHVEGTVLKLGALQGTVIGTVQDFNGLTLHEKIPAVVIRCSRKVELGQMYIRISPANTHATIAYIENQWKKFYPEYRFDFSFVDDDLQALYTADKRLGALFGIFSMLAIFISCLGLFGLISLTVQNRVKEIGVRKVLGASVFNITHLISKDFLKLVILSFIISSPIAWYVMTKWLQSFAYRINIEWWVFLLACLLAVVISLVTLSFQTIKAAIANPVKSLRSE